MSDVAEKGGSPLADARGSESTVVFSAPFRAATVRESASFEFSAPSTSACATALTLDDDDCFSHHLSIRKDPQGFDLGKIFRICKL
jgi:hypothetical protein